METVPCPISNSLEFTPFMQVPDRFDPSLRWQLVQSSASGLVMLNPRPDSSEIAAHYRSGCYDPYLHQGKGAALSERLYLAARSQLLGYRAHLVLHGAAKPFRELSILEIGCSTGDLLNFFHRSTGVPLAHLAGVEPDSASAAYARENFGLRVSSLLEGEYGETFDRIVLWHTLEHIHALNETLHAVAHLLAPDGVLVVALPNATCSGTKYYGENWVAWDAPRHLYHFLPGTLAKLLERHNLHLFKRIAYAPDAVYNALYSEKLCCERKARPFDQHRIGAALCRGAVDACRSVLYPLEAAGVVYFATLRPNALSSRVVAAR
ncbi:MAG: class I SAM-dependent methyltransferase [Chlorobium sp.]|nr:MAG: class I SAM-dependent methyltransferase [Chlorobium sp.]